MRYNFLASGYSIADETINRSSSTSSRIGHDMFIATGFEIWTGAGKTGTKLTLTTDYSYNGIDSDHTTKVGQNVYTKLSIVNGAYQNMTLYLTYTTVGDYASVENVEEISAKLIQPLTGQISADTTYTLPTTAARYLIYIPKGYLYASTDVFRWLTITTGTSGADSIKIPILASSNSTYVKRGLILNAYVDTDGNVETDADVILSTTIPYARYVGVVSTASGSPVRYDTKVVDTFGAVTTGSAWRFTSPVSGNYVLSASMAASAAAYNLIYYIDGSAVGTVLASMPAGVTGNGSMSIYLASGSYVDVRCSQTTTAGAGLITISYNGRM